MDRYLREEALAFIPLLLSWKIMETALHELVVWGEKALGQQETALDVFLDIEGAFNYTSFDTIYAALVRHWVSTPFSCGLELSGGPQ